MLKMKLGATLVAAVMAENPSLGSFCVGEGLLGCECLRRNDEEAGFRV